MNTQSPPSHIRSEPHEPVVFARNEPPDAGRWLVVTMIELSKRFLGMAVKAGYTEAVTKHECPRCGWRG